MESNNEVCDFFRFQQETILEFLFIEKKNIADLVLNRTNRNVDKVLMKIG